MGPTIQIVGFLLVVSLGFTHGDFSNVVNSLYQKANGNEKPLVVLLNDDKAKNNQANQNTIAASYNRLRSLLQPQTGPKSVLRTGNAPDDLDDDDSYGYHPLENDNDRSEQDSRDDQYNQERHHQNRYRNRQKRGRNNYRHDRYNDYQRNKFHNIIKLLNSQLPDHDHDRDSQSHHHHEPRLHSVYRAHEDIIVYPSHKHNSDHHDRQSTESERYNDRYNKLNRYSSYHPGKNQDRESYERYQDRHEQDKKSEQYRSVSNRYRQQSQNSYQNRYNHQNRFQVVKEDDRRDRDQDHHDNLSKNRYHSIYDLLFSRLKPYHSHSNRYQEQDSYKPYHSRSTNRYKYDQHDRDYRHDRYDQHDRDYKHDRYNRHDRDDHHDQYDHRDRDRGERYDQRYRDDHRSRYKSISRTGQQQQSPSRSPVVKSLLRISTNLRCGAQNQCKNECEPPKQNQCEEKCEEKFECEEEKEMCDFQDECQEDDNPSTRGVLYEPEPDPGCKRCKK